MTKDSPAGEIIFPPGKIAAPAWRWAGRMPAGALYEACAASDAAQKIAGRQRRKVGNTSS